MERLSKYSLDSGNKKTYGTRAEQWQVKADEISKKINEIYSEDSKANIVSASSVVDKQIINSTAYRKIFNKLSEETRVTRSVFQQVRDILIHRSGSNFEDLAFIDSKTGKALTQINYNVNNKCIPTKAMMNMVRESKPYTIISVHNHSGNSTPSIDDIYNAWTKKYKYGIVACHNGNIYKYRVIGEYNSTVVDILLDRVNKIIYNKVELGEKFKIKLEQTLQDLKNYNVELEVFLWE